MNGYIGNGNIAQKIKNIYIGIDDTARKVKKGYIGVDGIAKQFYKSTDTWNRYYINYNWQKYNCNATDVYAESSSSKEITYAVGGLGNTIVEEVTSELDDSVTAFLCSVSYIFYPSTGHFGDASTGYANVGAADQSTKDYPYAYIGKSDWGWQGDHMYQISPGNSQLYWRRNVRKTTLWYLALYYSNYITKYSGTLTTYTSYIASQLYSQGEYEDSFSTTVSNAYSDNIRNDDGYWYVYIGTSCGSQIDTIEADEGTYPDNGISGSYWYIKQ